jgi:ketosteroid isomerase-like protein
MSHHESATKTRAEENLEVATKLGDAFRAGDMMAGAELIADDIEWHEIGRDEPIRGKAALTERYNSPEAQAWNITAEPHDLLANDEHALALATATATKPNGETLVYRVVEIYHVNDGKITARWAFSDDTEAINRFFGS